MLYCQRDPYHKNSKEYFLNNVNHYEILYDEWMVKEYKTVLLNLSGSFSDIRDQEWAFATEEARTLFMLRWG